MATPEAEAAESGLVDRVAIGLSGLCLVHCVASFVLVALAISVGGLLLDPRIHEVGLAIAILLGVAAFSQGLRAHRRLRPMLVALIGFCTMGLSLLVPHGHVAEVPLTLLGVSLVAFGHHLNRRATLSPGRA